MRIAVVGGGNGSYATAADLALQGHSVRMWPGSREKHQGVYLTGAIRLAGLGRGAEAKLSLVTSDLERVVRGAEAVFSTDPAFTQGERARALAPYLEDGQVVCLSPGSMGGWLFRRVARRYGSRSRFMCAEPATLPYLARKTAAADLPTVVLSGRAVRLPVGVYPASRTDEALEVLGPLVPGAIPVENALSVALLNVGPILHSVLVLLNLGPIETQRSWDIHNEGSSPSAKKLILAHDDERMALRDALGFTPPHYPFSDHYYPSEDAEWMYGRVGHSDLVKGEKWREKLSLSHRYVEEDVAINLVLQASIGRLAGVATPIMDSLLTLYGSMLGRDLRSAGRSLRTLGLDGLSADEVNRLLESEVSA